VNVPRATSDEDKELRRAAMLAAKTVFSRAGYHGTTVAEIARTAGVSHEKHLFGIYEGFVGVVSLLLYGLVPRPHRGS
jgi:tetracycline repressor-like protein